MNDWTSGYVADLGYTHGFYRELTPAILRFAALGRGVVSPDVAGPLAYCELGCGQGFSANLLAAANPHIEFHATDFNPAHIVGARALARDAELANVHFYDDSFAQLLDRPGLPQFDIIALHGIYSWIAAEHRAEIVEFIRRRLKPGGLVYISYNALPGWSASAPLRHLMYLHAGTQQGPTAGRVGQALDFVGKVVGANAKYVVANPAAKTRAEQVAKQNHNYLAHEYLNDTWTLFYHSDVAAELAAAKLSFVGSAALLEQVDAINFTPDQKAMMDSVQHPVLRETLRDYMVNQQFRRDIFAKGTTPLSFLGSREIWGDLRFALSVPRTAASMKVNGALGEADLHAAVYAPLLDVLAEGPIAVRQLVADKRLADLGWSRLQEALIILVGSGQAHPCLPARDEGKRARSTKAFNRAVVRRARDNADLAFLASPVTGSGITVSRFAQLFLLAAEEGHKTPDAWARFAHDILAAQGQRIVKDGAPLQTAEENLGELTEQANAFALGQLPVLRTLLIA